MNQLSKLRGTTAVRNAFDGRRRLRSWRNTHFGGMEAVKAHPLSMCRFRPDEGGTVSTSLNVKLAPVSGYMRSKAYVDVVQIFVPYQAIEKLWLDTQPDAGVTEMARRRLMAGEGVPVIDQHIIDRCCNVHPRSVGGVKRVSASIRYAYNAAVNHLRKSAYHDAELLDRHDGAIQPAVLTANVLERFAGVLDPERNVDGAINLTGDLPLKIDGATANSVLGTSTAADGESVVETTIGTQFYTDLGGTGEISLRDMIVSQKVDGLVRKFAQMIQDDPVNGEEVVERALYGLTVDFDHNCQVVYRKVHELAAMHQRPTDGASINDVSGHFELNTSFATMVPRSELGGQLVTIAMVKPVETLAAQPDPSQTEQWQLVNRVHDETQLDEVLLTRADLESGVSAQDQDAPVFWVGHNALAHNYATQGPNEQQTHNVEMKSSMWTYEIPTSVTPENVSYPEAGIGMYPFFNWNGAHAEYTINQVAAISTSLAKGPTPVERIQLFADDPALISEEEGAPNARS